MIVGILALMAAMGERGETTSKQGAVARIADQPFGQILLGIVAAGLLFYAFWRLMAALADSEHKGTGVKGIGKRIGYCCSAIVYGSLGIYAAQLLIGSGAGSGDGKQNWIAWLMAKQFGAALVGIAGVILIGVGLAQFFKAHKESFRENLRLSQMSPSEDKWATRAGKWGYVSRGVVFAIMGGFLINAAGSHNPNEARGLEGALDALAGQPYGAVLLAVVAAGLAAYGAYMFVEAKYRQVRL
jgi:hypothetical protein